MILRLYISLGKTICFWGKIIKHSTQILKTQERKKFKAGKLEKLKVVKYIEPKAAYF